MKLLLVGGFLGAGKTTLIHGAIKYLQSIEKNVSVITNDQGKCLVDTGYLSNISSSVNQVGGGCFCCNFLELQKILEVHTKQHAEYIFAEAVGSCADIISTVVKPIQLKFNKIQPILTVLVDATLLYSCLINQKYFFKSSVKYIWEKQFEEADLIIISKMDLLPPSKKSYLIDTFCSIESKRKILFQNNKVETFIKNWINEINKFEFIPRALLNIDYDTYAEGEAALSWLDAEIKIVGIKSKLKLFQIISQFKSVIQNNNHFIGHLKFLIINSDQRVKLSITSTYEDTFNENYISNSFDYFLTVNARVECEPNILLYYFERVINDTNGEEISLQVDYLNCFNPSYPRPLFQIKDFI